MLPTKKRDRKLKKEEDVFKFNAWDDTEWTDEMLDDAEKQLNQQRIESKKSTGEIQCIENKSRHKWNEFYKTHRDGFFKDRKWILTEFPELTEHLGEHSAPCRMMEVGCGVGNAIGYLQEVNTNKDFTIYCCDVSSEALDLLKSRNSKGNGLKIVPIHADISQEFDEKCSSIIEKNSLDFITVIFTLSATKPNLMSQIISNLATLLKDGGMILFRDYAKYDLAQLRFKGSSMLGDNYYVRSDGTTTYFFETKFVEEIFSNVGLLKLELKNDNRLLVNRAKSLKMCRCWIQAKYIKQK